MDIEPLDLDNSRLETYALCPMKYHNQYNLELATSKHLNTRFSTHMVHDPITEWYYRGLGWAPTAAEWERAQASVGLTPEESAVKSNAVYNVVNAQRLFEFYTTRYAEDLKRFRCLGIENYIVKDGFGSKPDVRLEEIATGRLWTAELKFSDWDFILEAATMNPQFLGQVRTTNGHGCLVTLLQASGTKWGSFGAARLEIEPKPEELEQWWKDTQFKMDNVRRSYQSGVWPKHTPNACTAYGGCAFVDLCSAGHPPEMLKRWPKNPNSLAYLKEGSQVKPQDSSLITA